MRDHAASCCCDWRTWGITNAFALLRLLRGGDRDKDIEILSLRTGSRCCSAKLDGQQVRFAPVDRAWLAALLHPLPRPTLRRLRLLVRPDTRPQVAPVVDIYAATGVRVPWSRRSRLTGRSASSTR